MSIDEHLLNLARERERFDTGFPGTDTAQQIRLQSEFLAASQARWAQSGYFTRDLKTRPGREPNPAEIWKD